MNILVVGKFYTEGFAQHISETLAAMGYSVRHFEPGVASGRIAGVLGHRLDQVRRVLHSTTDALPAVRARRMRALWEVADEGPLDVVIVTHDFLWPGEVAELRRRTGAAVAMWFPDSLANFGRGYFMTAPYDALFFKDPYVVTRLADVLPSPVYYLPECFNPRRHWLPDEELGDDPAYRCDIATAGNLHSWRVAVFRHLEGRDVRIWGPPGPLWMNAGPVARMSAGRPVHDHEKVRAFRGAKIVLNNLHYSEIWGLNARCFEVAGAGAFQMVDWRPGLDHLFADGTEIVAFRGTVDLKEKIEHWLPREEERRNVANAGMRRAHWEHTYSARLERLLQTVTGGGRGWPLPEIRDGRSHWAKA